MLDDDGVHDDEAKKDDIGSEDQAVKDGQEPAFADTQDDEERPYLEPENEEDRAAREQAASKIQAIQRGRAVRKNMNTNSGETDAEEPAFADSQDDQEKPYLEPENEEDRAARDQAASKIQAIQRGRAVRKNMNATSEGDDAEDRSLAALKTQAVTGVASSSTGSPPRNAAKASTTSERSKKMKKDPTQATREVKRSESRSPERSDLKAPRTPKRSPDSGPREWDSCTAIEAPLDPLSMATLSRRPEGDAPQVAAGGRVRTLNSAEPSPWERLYQQAQAAQPTKTEISKVPKSPRSAEDQEIFRLRNEVHLLRREVARLQQELPLTAAAMAGNSAKPEPMRFGLQMPTPSNRTREKDASEKGGDKATPAPSKAEILAALKAEQQTLKMEAQRLKQRGPLSPKKSGDAKKSDPMPAETAAEPVEEKEEKEDSADKPLLSSKKGKEAKEALQSVLTAARTEATKKLQESAEKSSSPKGKDSPRSVTRSTKQVAPSQKPALNKGRDASRSATPVRMAARAKAAARTPSPKEATSRSVTPKKLNFTPAERRAGSPGQRRTPSPSQRSTAAQAWKNLAKAPQAKPTSTASKFQQLGEKLRRSKSPTPKQHSVSPLQASRGAQSKSPSRAQSKSPSRAQAPSKATPRRAASERKVTPTRSQAVPQIFDRLHQEHAHRMWILEERQAVAKETEQRVARALQERTVTVGSAAEARAAGRRLYDEAQRSRQRLEQKRQQKNDVDEAQNRRAGSNQKLHLCSDSEPRWEQLYACANQKQQRLAERRLLQELEEEEWMNSHDLHRGLEEDYGPVAYERLYQDALQRGERLFVKEQRKLQEESKQLSQGCVHQMTLGSDFASRIAEQRSQFLFEDARQRKERRETKLELEEQLRRERSERQRSTPKMGAAKAPSRSPKNLKGEMPSEVPPMVQPPRPNMFEVLRPESPGARKLLQQASRNKMQSTVMSQMLMSRVVQAFGSPMP